MKWKSAWPFFLVAVVASGVAIISSAANIVTTVTATPPAPILTQANYGWYNNIDALTPSPEITTDNTAIPTPAIGSQLRLRMNIGDMSLLLPSSIVFTLQYANATTGPWTDVSTSTPWQFFDNPSVADGQVIVSTLVTSSTIGESYGESNPSAASPNQLFPTDFGEWDWVLVNSAANTAQPWFFRMEYASATPLDHYRIYPGLTAVSVSTSTGGGPGNGGSGGGSGGQGNGGGTGFNTPTGTIKTPPVEPTLPTGFECVDFNHDNRVDIIDLSILLYYYGRTPPGDWCGFLTKGPIDFKDLSILMYYWTK